MSNRSSNVAFATNVNLCDRYTDAYEQITDDFSVKFYDWLQINEQELNYSKIHTTTELLQIFKTQYYEKE